MNQLEVSHDFDFLLDTWDIINKRRKLTSLYDKPENNKETEWEFFPAVGGMGERMLDGRVIVDYFDGTFPDGEHRLGITLRAYEPSSGLWSLLWIDNRFPLDLTPLQGRFENGIGQFNQLVTTTDGRPLNVQFMWEFPSAAEARWSQSFSLDGGETWDTNWIMDFSNRRPTSR